MSGRVLARAAVDGALHAWLQEQLPAAEFAAQLASRPAVVLEQVAGTGTPPPGTATTALAVGITGVETLSGAGLWVALAGDPPGADVAPLAAALHQLVAAHGGVELVGPTHATAPVADAVATAAGTPATCLMSQRLLAAREVHAPSGVAGAGRTAGREDRALLAGWFDDFSVEALGTAPRGVETWLDQVAEAGAALRVWEHDGEVVSLVHARPTTPVSSRIGPVYTPPGHRGRGYAGALTAEVTQRALDAGDHRVTLLTDVRNPTSNRLYERLGYTEVCAHGSWSVLG